MKIHIKNKLIKLYKQMYDLTEPECRNTCRCPHSCCSPEYCNMTTEWAKSKWNVILQPTNHSTLPLMGFTGCIAAPHLRPWCTLHTCDMNSLGFKRNDLDWTKKYTILRNKIEALESKDYA